MPKVIADVYMYSCVLRKQASLCLCCHQNFNILHHLQLLSPASLQASLRFKIFCMCSVCSDMQIEGGGSLHALPQPEVLFKLEACLHTCATCDSHMYAANQCSANDSALLC